MTLATRSHCDCGRPLGDDLTWHCGRCHRRVWRGAFRHVCIGQLVAEHAHSVELWREANPGTPCPCHEWAVGTLRWGTWPGAPEGLILPR